MHSKKRYVKFKRKLRGLLCRYIVVEHPGMHENVRKHLIILIKSFLDPWKPSSSRTTQIPITHLENF